MKNRHILGFACLSLFGILACKDTVDPPKVDEKPSKTPQEYLTVSKWKISNLVSSGTDIWNTPFVEACNKDNEYNFRSDDSLTMYDNSNKCDSNDPDSTTSSYKFYNNNTQLILNARLTSSVSINDTVKIVELNDEILKIDAEYSGLPATVTFKHK